jgi:hypothetical protein
VIVRFVPAPFVRRPALGAGKHCLTWNVTSVHLRQIHPDAPKYGQLLDESAGERQPLCKGVIGHGSSQIASGTPKCRLIFWRGQEVKRMHENQST